jgi:hypothetical protein
MNKSNFHCHDCKKSIKVIKDKTNDGVVLVYELPDKSKMTIMKCNDCYLKDKSLRNYQPVECYSRVVGYLRPVQQWNTGKQKEFEQRKEFKI